MSSRMICMKELIFNCMQVCMKSFKDVLQLPFTVIICITSLFFSSSDEDDALYEKLSGEQWRLETLMHLLGELKDCDLPGTFFLDLLKARTTAIRPNNTLYAVLCRLLRALLESAWWRS